MIVFLGNPSQGHTAHASSSEAVETAREMLDMYASVCEDLLAIPTVKGQKSPSERFAGADDTYTIEALMQNGWALQSGTSHFLGQNFARAFDVFFQTEKSGTSFLIFICNFHVLSHLLLNYICKLHWNLNTMFVCQVNYF